MTKHPPKMEDINERFPMCSKKAAKMVASIEQTIETGKSSNWSTHESEKTSSSLPTKDNSLGDNDDEKGALLSSTIHDSEEEIETGEKRQNNGETQKEGNSNSISFDDDYSYFNTMDFLKNSLHVLTPPALIIFVGGILFLTGSLAAHLWSHLLEEDHVSFPSIGALNGKNGSIWFSSASNGANTKDTKGTSFSNSFSNDLVCAPWIPKEKRKIILRKHTRLNDWESYQNGNGYLGGEGYWSASLMYILQSLDFEVIIDGHNPYGTPDDIEKIKNGNIYRVIVDSYFNKDDVTEDFQNDSESMCHVRFFEWWSRTQTDLEETYGDVRKVLTPYDYSESSSTTIPFFVHSEITLPSSSMDRSSRGRTALLLDKQCDFSKILLNGLLEAGYELYLTCFEKHKMEKVHSMVQEEYKFKLHQYSKLTPIEFAKALRKVSIVIGFGNPRDSPTPLEGLANGAAFLNPTSADEQHAQHAILKTLGPPYVYNYFRSPDETTTLENILEMADMAIQHPFGSYIPFQHRWNVVREQVCANLIEPDNICECIDMNQESLESNSNTDRQFCQGKF